MRLNETRKNLAANPERSPLMRSYGYASAGDRSAFADMDVGVRATQRSGVPEQLAEFARFPLVFVPFVQYAGQLNYDVEIRRRYLLGGDKIHCYQFTFGLRHTSIKPVIFVVGVVGQVKLRGEAFPVS
jgi:hypothetical protein